MKIEASIIRAAFDIHYQRYIDQPRASNVPKHVALRRLAGDAFSEESFDKFYELYEELRRKWQVFRGAAGQPWSAKKTFDRFKALDATYRTKRLSKCHLGDADTLWKVLGEIEGIKTTKYGPSIVAMSKFLHFWNPRLFIIVDYAMIWQAVLRPHPWLWDEVKAVRSRVEARLPDKRTDTSDEVCDLVTYLSILLWAGELVRANPTIASCFAEYVAAHADGRGLPLAEYEGMAVEWFLMGLVELPPAGVRQ